MGYGGDTMPGIGILTLTRLWTGGGGRKASHPVDLARPARVSVEQSQPLHACWLLTGCRSGMHTCCYAPSSRAASLVNEMLQMGSGALSMAPVHLPRSTGQGQSWKYKYGASSSSPLATRLVLICFNIVSNEITLASPAEKRSRQLVVIPLTGYIGLSRTHLGNRSFKQTL